VSFSWLIVSLFIGKIVPSENLLFLEQF